MKPYNTIPPVNTTSLLKNKVFWISALMLLVIATTFWTQSRLPALNNKAQVGDRINISSIAFNVVYPIIDSQPLYERTYKAAINWGYTNWKGMTFGFLLAAAFITLLQSLPKTLGSKHKFLNSAIGLIIGAPLSVCVNCATPIAQGMIHAGTRLEVALAMLLSSPTLNPIVLTIAFSLLSFHVALIKVLASVFFILILVPLLVKLSGHLKATPSDMNEIEHQANQQNSAINPPQYDAQLRPQNWLRAIQYSFIAYAKNLFYIMKFTLPFMIIAGFLGSFLIEALPTGSLSSLGMEPLTLFIIAAIGVFLPVPIAFDVMIVSILINSGLSVGLASTLLFSLGIFSIYPALIIGRSISIKLSLLFFISILLFAVATGVITQAIDKNINLKSRSTIEKALGKQGPRISFQDAVATCEIFKASKRDKACLNTLLLSDLFDNVTIEDCKLDANKNTPSENTDNIKMCQQIVYFADIKKLAVKNDNIKLCDNLASEKLKDECRIHHIRSHSNEYTSLDACLQVKSTGGQRYCHAMVVADRMKSKSPSSCDLGLSSDMHRQCIDNLNAHITSELGELDKCESLTTENARSICRSTVFSLKISKLQEYSICKKLTSNKEINTCEDQVIMQKALQQKAPALCGSLSNRRMITPCQINAVIQDKRAKIESQKFSAFDHSSEYHVIPKTENLTSKKIKTKPLIWTETITDQNISIASTPHLTRELKSGNIFKRISAEKLGIKATWNINLTDFMEPFVYGKGIASGDFNNDGWPDLAFASSNGLHLYKNNGQGTFSFFKHIKIENQFLNAFVVSFVDIDNDGWQDLFITSYNNGNIFFKNEKGTFSNQAFIKLQEANNIVALAAGFADWNKDGLLDLAIGNWSYGAEGAFIPQKSQNVWYTNDKLTFKPTFPDEMRGETLSILISDINNDKHTDLIIGNDRKYPDMFYYGKDKGEFKQITRDMKLIPGTSFNTMSYDSADFNNDLLLDVFSTDMSMAIGKSRYYCDSLLTQTDKKRCEWLLKGVKAVKSLNVGWCEPLTDYQRAECFTAMALKLAKRDRDNLICNKVSSNFSGKPAFCHNIAHKLNDVKLKTFTNNLSQKETNKLLLNNQNGIFTDATKTMGVKNSFWGWNGKAADLDNDGWQDIYIGNGLGFGQHDKNIHSNVFYHNQKGKKFTRAEKQFGLVNYTNTPNYTYVDFDIDGDIDIISSGIMSTPVVFINQGTTGNSISFILRDEVGNRFCIGCKIEIYYDNKKKHQVRELKLSGGFMSFDDTVLYFGLNKNEHINGIKVIWSTGEEWRLNQTFKANQRYKITRHSEASAKTN